MRKKIYLVILLLSLCLTSCGDELPLMVISNKSQVTVLVRKTSDESTSFNILAPNDKRTFFFPGPGLVRVSVIQDAQWVPEINAARDLLEDQLTQARNNKQPLSETELRKIRDQLRRIDTRLTSTWQNAKVASCDLDFGTSSCEGNTGDIKPNGSVVIEERNGQLTVSCSTRK